MNDTTAKLLLAAGAIAAIAFVVKKNGGLGAVVAGAAGNLGQALGGAVVEGGRGLVLGIGDAIGVPRTDMTECERAIAEGRSWDASFACPAGTFLSSVADGLRTDYPIYGDPAPLSDWMGTIASRPINPWVVSENAGGAAFVYPRIRRAN